MSDGQCLMTEGVVRLCVLVTLTWIDHVALTWCYERALLRHGGLTYGLHVG